MEKKVYQKKIKWDWAGHAVNKKMLDGLKLWLVNASSFLCNFFYALHRYAPFKFAAILQSKSCAL